MVKETFSRGDFIHVCEIGSQVSRLEIAIGFIEFITKNFFHSNFITQATIAFCGSYGSQHADLLKRSIFYELQGTTQEVSYFTTTIFYICMLFFAYCQLCPEKKDKYLRWIIASVFLLIVNPGLSTVVMLVGIFVVYFCLFRKAKDCKSDNRKLVFTILFIVFLGFIFINYANVNYRNWIGSDNYLLKRLGVSFEQVKIITTGGINIAYGSEAIRLTGIFYDLKLILKKPLFGFGIGNVSCNSGLITLIVNIGIIGFLSWQFYLYVLCTNKKSNIRVLIFAIACIYIPNLILNDFDTITAIYIPIIVMAYSFAFNNLELR